MALAWPWVELTGLGLGLEGWGLGLGLGLGTSGLVNIPGANTRGGIFFCDFRLKSLFISETVRDRPTVLWNVNRKS